MNISKTDGKLCIYAATEAADALYSLIDAYTVDWHKRRRQPERCVSECDRPQVRRWRDRIKRLNKLRDRLRAGISPKENAHENI